MVDLKRGRSHHCVVSVARRVISGRIAKKIRKTLPASQYLARLFEGANHGVEGERGGA